MKIEQLASRQAAKHGAFPTRVIGTNMRAVACVLKRLGQPWTEHAVAAAVHVGALKLKVCATANCSPSLRVTDLGQCNAVVFVRVSGREEEIMGYATADDLDQHVSTVEVWHTDRQDYVTVPIIDRAALRPFANLR